MASDTAWRPVRRTLWLLVGVAVAAEEVAVLSPDTSPAVGLARAGVLLALAWLVGQWRPLRGGEGKPIPRSAFVLLLALTLLPYPLEPLHAFLAGPRPLELLLLDSMRNLCLGLAALSAWPLCHRLAALSSLFLTLFATAMGTDALAVLLVGGYGGVGTVWLMLAYWAGLRQTRDGSGPRLPWPAALAVPAVVLSVLGLGALGPQHAARLLAELLPTSGGTGGYDPTSRGGLNDGDDEARGRNARSVGFVENDVFVEDERPSLYDAVSDTYGEPFKPKERERMIALAPQEVSESDRPPAENLAPSREFPTARQSPAQPRQPADRYADALFFVVGRTPLLLRMVAYDHFDGVAWREGERPSRPCVLEKERAGCWMTVTEAKRTAIFAASERHQIRIAKLKAEQFPTPPHLAGFRVGKVDRTDFFAWAQDGILRMQGRRVPSAITLDAESRTVDPELLAEAVPIQGAPPGPERYFQMPEGTVAAEALALARRWAEGKPRGWAEVEAVVNGLRGHAEHDRTVSAPEGCRDTVGYFLLQARRGPDYQFASAAAVLLRSLGYGTRVMAGFYVRPEHYDVRTGQTPVNNDDIHFWTEVLLPGNVWVAVEPTPGYVLPGPRLTWGAWLLASARENAPTLAGGCLGLLLLTWRRRQLLDAAGVWLWRWRAADSWRGRTLEALRLLERRSRWAGRPRPPGATPLAWYGGMGRAWPEEHAALIRLAALAGWAAHAPADLPPPCSPREAGALCAGALRAWTWRRFRRAGNEVTA